MRHEQRKIQRLLSPFTFAVVITVSSLYVVAVSGCTTIQIFESPIPVLSKEPS